MNENNRSARVVGVLFIIGTAAGILSGIFTMPVFEAPEPLAAIETNPNQLITGAVFVLLMGFALAMIPAVLFPIFRKINESLAVGAVIFRGVLEAAAYIGIVLCWMLLIPLAGSRESAGAGGDAIFRLAYTMLLDGADWINLLLAIVFSIGALMIYVLFYKSKLIPRWLSGWGLAGGILYLAAALLTMFDPQHPPLSLDNGIGILMAPLALQEMVLALWLIVKGFNSRVDVLHAEDQHPGNVYARTQP